MSKAAWTLLVLARLAVEDLVVDMLVRYWPRLPTSTTSSHDVTDNKTRQGIPANLFPASAGGELLDSEEKEEKEDFGAVDRVPRSHSEREEGRPVPRGTGTARREMKFAPKPSSSPTSGSLRDKAKQRGSEVMKPALDKDMQVKSTEELSPGRVYKVQNPGSMFGDDDDDRIGWEARMKALQQRSESKLRVNTTLFPDEDDEEDGVGSGRPGVRRGIAAGKPGR